MHEHDGLKGLLRIEDGCSVIAGTSSQSDRRKKMAAFAAAKFREETSTGHEPRARRYSSAESGFNMNFVRRSMALETHLHHDKKALHCIEILVGERAICV
jgi:hypothetical protein